MGKVPLGPSKSQSRARTAGHDDDANLTRGQRVGPDAGGAALRDALAIGLG